MIDKPGSFVSAALPSISVHIKNTMKDHNDVFTNEQISSFFSKNTNKFLTSIGVVIPRLSTNPVKREKEIASGRMNEALIQKYVDILEQFNSFGFLK